MSIRAYRINEIKREKSKSFNLWHDEKLVDKLRSGGYLESLNCSGSGMIEIPVRDWKELLKENKKVKFVDNDTVKQIKKDIAWAKQKGEEYLQYECF